MTLVIIVDDRLEALTELATEIETLINTSECGEGFECRFIAFGSKACGGPQRYLAYSTSIDTLELQNLVSIYNSDEEAYNIACDIVSTCDFIGPPSGVECINGVCTLID